jgi:hypothetical protein
MPVRRERANRGGGRQRERGKRGEFCGDNDRLKEGENLVQHAWGHLERTKERDK